LSDAHSQLQVTGRDLGIETEALTAEEALGSYTLGGAFVTGREDRQGSIAPSKLADLVVLDRDPLATPPDELEHVRPIATMLVERGSTQRSDNGQPNPEDRLCNGGRRCRSEGL
jgi:predicted amidohydrolase YtcJ